MSAAARAAREPLVGVEQRRQLRLGERVADRERGRGKRRFWVAEPRLLQAREARELRELASTTHDEKTRADLLVVADQYDSLAKRVEDD